jgi:hypothetical protein
MRLPSRPPTPPRPAFHAARGRPPAALDAFKLARLRERAASDKISQALGGQLHDPDRARRHRSAGLKRCTKIPKQIEKFADRYSLATTHLEHIDFAPRAAMLEQAPAWWWRWWPTCATEPGPDDRAREAALAGERGPTA